MANEKSHLEYAKICKLMPKEEHSSICHPIEEQPSTDDNNNNDDNAENSTHTEANVKFEPMEMYLHDVLTFIILYHFY